MSCYVGDKNVPLLFENHTDAFVHRENGDIKFLTKGDNNAVDDRGLYKQGQHWLEKKDVVGRARG